MAGLLCGTAAAEINVMPLLIPASKEEEQEEEGDIFWARLDLC